MEKQGPFFGKEESAAMAGIAVLLMVWHHLFNFPEWLSDGVNWHPLLGNIGAWATKIPALFGSICVQVFAIISGYALYCNPNAYSTAGLRLKRLGRFMVGYWAVCLLFLGIGLANSDTMPPASELIWNLFGLHLGPSKWINVPFAWYVAFYIEFVLLAPVLLRLMRNGGVFANLATLAGIFLLIITLYILALGTIVEPIVSVAFTFIAAIVGMLIAKYGVFDRLSNMFARRLLPIALLALIGALMVIAYVAIGQAWGIIGENVLYWKIFLSTLKCILAPLLILFCVELLRKLPGHNIRRALMWLGGVSMYVWFLHGIFFTGKHFLQPFVYMPQEPVLVFALCLALVVPAAWLVKTALAKTGLTGASRSQTRGWQRETRGRSAES